MSPKLLQPFLVLLAALLVACPGVNNPDFDSDGSPDAEDCAPEDSEIHPGANDPYGDGIDQDCGGTDGFDGDGDGFPAQEDCNDNDATIHPGADEIEGNGIDEDCDGFDLGGGDDDDDDTTTDGDTYEPNDSSSEAAGLGEGGYSSLTIAGSDEDWFVVDANGSTVTARIGFSHSAGDLDMQLLDENGSQIDSSAGTSDSEEVEGADDKVYVRVYGYNSATGDYDLTITVD